jgi:hypothetical protein
MLLAVRGRAFCSWIQYQILGFPWYKPQILDLSVHITGLGDSDSSVQIMVAELCFLHLVNEPGNCPSKGWQGLHRLVSAVKHRFSLLPKGS